MPDRNFSSQNIANILVPHCYVCYPFIQCKEIDLEHSFCEYDMRNAILDSKWKGSRSRHCKLYNGLWFIFRLIANNILNFPPHAKISIPSKSPQLFISPFLITFASLFSSRDHCAAPFPCFDSLNLLGIETSEHSWTFPLKSLFVCVCSLPSSDKMRLQIS